MTIPARARRDRGFTLLEALLYIALLSVIVASGLTAAFGLIESGVQESSSAAIAEEADFLRGKIGRAIAEADAAGIVAPTAADGDVLEVRPKDGSAPVRIVLVDGTVTIARGDAAAEALNGGDVQVASLAFHRILGRGGPVGVTTSFTLLNTSARPPMRRDYAFTDHPTRP